MIMSSESISTVAPKFSLKSKSVLYDGLSHTENLKVSAERECVL